MGATFSAIANWRLGDADDYLRLVQVRDLIAGQGWWDVTQYRMNVPDGGPMHWSRLIDIPIALIIIILQPFLGQSLAEQSAVTIVPLATYGLFLFFAAGAARRLFDHHSALLSAAVMFALLPVINQFLPGRIDHHGWQLVLFSACLYAILDRERRIKSSVIIGVSLAAWVEISVEALPYIAIFMGLLALRWLGEDSRATKWKQFPAALLALSGSSIAFLLVNEGPKFAQNYCDSFSLFHTAAFCAATLVVLLGGIALPRIGISKQLPVKLLIGGVAGVAGIAAILFSAPQCAGDAFGALDPLVREYWYNFVPEGRPLWEIQPQFAAQPLAGILITAVAAIWFMAKSDARPAYDRSEIFLVFLACAITGLLVQRTAAYALVVGIILASALAIKMFRHSDSKDALLPRIGIKLAALLLVVPTIAGQYGYSLAKPTAGKQAEQTQEKEEAFAELALECHRYESIELLDSLPKSNLMMGLDVSPSVLLLTKHNIVATGHHRNQTAMKDVIETFISPPAKARQILAARGIDYVLTCPGSFELYRYEKNAPDGLLARLRKGAAPEWLKRQKPVGPYQLWRVEGSSNER